MPRYSGHKRRRSRRRSKTPKLTAYAIQKALMPVNVVTWDRVFAIDNNVQNGTYWQVLPPICTPQSTLEMLTQNGIVATATDALGNTLGGTTAIHVPAHVYNNKALVTIINTGAHMQEVRLFECTPRDDYTNAVAATATGANVQFVDGLQKAAMENLVQGWMIEQASGQVNTGGTGTTVVYNTATSFCTDLQKHTPYMSQDFCMRFKILHSGKKWLGPGQKWRLKMTSKAFNYDLRENPMPIPTEDALIGYGGISKFYLIAINGDIGKQTNDDTLVGTMKTDTAIGFVYTANFVGTIAKEKNRAFKITDKPTLTGNLEGPTVYATIAENQ